AGADGNRNEPIFTEGWGQDWGDGVLIQVGCLEGELAGFLLEIIFAFEFHVSTRVDAASKSGSCTMNLNQLLLHLDVVIECRQEVREGILAVLSGEVFNGDTSVCLSLSTYIGIVRAHFQLARGSGGIGK